MGFMSESSLKKALKYVSLVALTCWLIIISVSSEVIFRSVVILFMVLSVSYFRHVMLRFKQLLKDNGLILKDNPDSGDQIEINFWNKNAALEELLERAELTDEEKEHYKKRLLDEAQGHVLQHEKNDWKTKLQAAIASRHKKKEDSRSNHLIAVMKLLETDFILTASFEDLNRKLNGLKPDISSEIVDFLREAGYIDEDTQLTRYGYKMLVKTARKQKANTRWKQPSGML